MATELDNLPDEETPTGLNEVETIEWLQSLNDEIKEAALAFTRDNDIGEWVWLNAYLDPESHAYGNASEAAKVAWPKIANKGYCYQKGNAMIVKHRERIKAWLDECGYSAEEIKLKTRRMFDAKKTVFFQKDGEVISERITEDNQAILKALELASKHQGLLKERVEHTGPNGGPIQITDTERAARLDSLLESARARRAGQADKP